METLLGPDTRKADVSVTPPLPPELPTRKEGAGSTCYSDSSSSTSIKLLSSLSVGGLAVER